MHSIKEIVDTPRTDTRAGQQLQEALTTATDQLPSGSPISKSPDCGKCDDIGWVPVAVNGKSRMQQCECTIPKAINAALPARYRGARLSDFSPQLIELVVSWLADPGDGMFFYGATGTGKTYMAAAIFRQQMESRKKVKFARMADFYLKVRDAYRDSDLSEDAVISEFSGSRLLIMDDLGAGSLSDHERRLALELVDRRLNAELPTIVTSNWSLPEISSKMDERLASRLGSYKQIKFSGEDRRRA